jgi:hypothetical protein
MDFKKALFLLLEEMLPYKPHPLFENSSLFCFALPSSPSSVGDH